MRDTWCKTTMKSRLVAALMIADVSLMSGTAQAERSVCSAHDSGVECLQNLRLPRPHDHASDHAPATKVIDSSYSCDLRNAFAQCRHFSVLRDASASLANVEESCQSLQGVFQRAPCPKENRVAICTNIVRNLHQPDILYDNHYYAGYDTQWPQDDLTRVCGDLGGELELSGK